MNTEPAVRCWLCSWHLNPGTAVRSDRDGRKPTCSDCARIRYGPGPPAGFQPSPRRPDHDQVAQAILQAIQQEVPALSAETLHFLEVLVRRAPSLGTVRRLAAALEMLPGSLQSRFSRARLPSVKDYLAFVRLLYAARYFEDKSVSCGLVAYRLDYSSPQSFNRHLKSRLGLVASEFRGSRFDHLLGRFLETLVAPHRATLAHFDPFPRRQATSPRQSGAKALQAANS
jgi:AraC-like DNA-binding protein